MKKLLQKILFAGTVVFIVSGAVFVFVQIQNFPQECVSAEKTVHASVDDVFGSLKALADPRVQSIYDVKFFYTLKKWNEKYGAKFTLYVYGEDGNGFGLKCVPAKFKNEFAEARSWLRFGVHASYTSIEKTKAQSGEEFKRNFENAKKEIIRFAGTESLSSILRLDYFFAKSEWEEYLFSAGTQTLLGPDTENRLAYSLSLEDSNELFKNGVISRQFGFGNANGGGVYADGFAGRKNGVPVVGIVKNPRSEKHCYFYSRAYV